MGSLRTRLFLSLTAIVVLSGIAAGGLAFRWAFDEAVEFQDSILVQIATLTESARFPGNVLAGTVVDSDAQLFIQELEDGGAEAGHSAWLRDLPDGLQYASRDDEMWRLLIKTRSDGSRVAIGQSTEIRDEIARDSALRAVLSLAVVLPGLLLVLGLVIRQTFRPISKLAARLDARPPDNLERLSLEGVASELRPFIASINGLFERIGRMVDQQRRFFADASHELRSPITALSLQAENLLQAELPPASRDRVAVLKDGTRRTAHLLEQLLALARYDTVAFPDLPAVQLDDCVKEVVADLLPRAMERGIDLGFERIAAVAVRCERVALTVMIRNLLDNALRHTPQGGRIDISICRGDDCAELQIADTGPGIAEADIARIFEPFFRGQHPVSDGTRNDGAASDGTGNDGTGLGLSIVRRIVERFNGSIKLENIDAPGRSGLCVTVCLPVAG